MWMTRGIPVMPDDVIEFITSDQIVDDVDRHFKVIAGPGAGKTYWLINHVKNILKNSTKLLAPSKVACITYTNVAVEEIQKRLEMTGDRIEVSTIHSFLYNNIVKPYVYLLKYDNGACMVNSVELDGHDDHIPSIGRILGNKAMSALVMKNKVETDELLNCISSLDWTLSGGNTVLQPRNEWQRKRFKKFINSGFFNVYKATFWNEGIIHHEDVLHFTYTILKSYPLIREFLAAKYPYILLDEFQDTNPIQTEIVKWLAHTGSTVGVIGDPAQSIYKFQGASRKDFLDFRLPNQKNYEMRFNRRSTRKILDVLNHMRGDDSLVQDCHRDIDGNEVCLILDKNITGVMSKYTAERERLGLHEDTCIVTPRNNCVTKLKSCSENCNYSIWADINKADQKRQRFLEVIFTAQEHANNLRFETAVKEIMKIFKTDKEGNLKAPFSGSIAKDSLIKRSLSVELMEYLVNNRVGNMTKTLLVFYNDLYSFFNSIGLTITKIGGAGAFKALAQNAVIVDLVKSLKMREEKNSSIRTIHKAKGTEFQSVLVYFDDNKDIANIIAPQIESDDDDSRLFYVALSRAKDFLCIAVNGLAADQKVVLEQLNIRIIS